jgi:hypothetical protein
LVDVNWLSVIYVGTHWNVKPLGSWFIRDPYELVFSAKELVGLMFEGSVTWYMI